MKERFIDRFWTWIKLLIVAGVLVFIIRGFIFIPFTTTGISMEETINQGDHVIMEKFSSLKRFDIIVFKSSDGNTYIKRIVGLPGEHVSYKNDELYIDGKVVKEPFLEKEKAVAKEGIPYTPDFDLNEVQEAKEIGKDEYFVLGDNRRLSKDSRSFGTIQSDQVIGKAIMVYYPFRDFKVL